MKVPQRLKPSERAWSIIAGMNACATGSKIGSVLSHGLPDSGRRGKFKLRHHPKFGSGDFKLHGAFQTAPRKLFHGWEADRGFTEAFFQRLRAPVPQRGMPSGCARR